MKKIINQGIFLGGCIASASSFAATNAVLSATPGLTPLQAQTASAVQAVCVELSGLGETITSNGYTARSDLFQQCNAMVRNGNQLQGSGSSVNSLGLSSAGLGSALQNVATEEMASTSRISTSTLSGQLAALNSHIVMLHNKIGGGAGDEQNFSLKGINVFVMGTGGFGDTKTTAVEDGIKFNNQGVVFGGDYRIGEHAVAGLAGAYSHINNNFIGGNVSGGSIQTDVYNVSMFGTYDFEDAYVDGVLSYGTSNYQSQRGVFISSSNPLSTGGANRIATSNPDGNQYSVAGGIGYKYHYDALKISPFLRGAAMYGQIDGYDEQGANGLNLTVNEQRYNSVQTIVGTLISYAFSMPFGVVTPEIALSWNHEFQNDSRNILAHYSADPGQLTLTATTANPTRDFYLVRGGVSTVLQGGMQLFMNYQSLLGYQNVTSHGFNAGLRYEF